MPAYQTTYAPNIGPAVAGMIADMQTATIITRVVEPAAGIVFGAIVTQGVADNGAAAPATGGVYKGVAAVSDTIAPTSAGAVPNLYPTGANAAVITYGVVWVTAAVAVAAGQPAYFTPATGALTNVASGNTAIPNASFDGTAAAGALVKLRLA